MAFKSMSGGEHSIISSDLSADFFAYLISEEWVCYLFGNAKCPHGPQVTVAAHLFYDLIS